MKAKFILLTCLIMFSGSAYGQFKPRIFLDIPGIYFYIPDFYRLGGNQYWGGGIESSLSLATHWSVFKVSGGASFNNYKDSENFVFPRRYFSIELGGGPYRTNRIRLARNDRYAFTAMVIGGIRYDYFYDKDSYSHLKNNLAEYTVGVDLGWYFDRGKLLNYEIYAKGIYYTNAIQDYYSYHQISATVGVKMCFALKKPEKNQDPGTKDEPADDSKPCIPLVVWQNPSSEFVNISSVQVTLKACIENNCAIDKVSLYVDGREVSINWQDIASVKSECSNLFEQEITLPERGRPIKIELVLSTPRGAFKSERTITAE